MNTQKLVYTSLLVALSFVGAHVTIAGSIALDALPAFFGALVLGPVYGVAIGMVGHFLSAMLSGFPLTLPLHLAITVAMGMTMLGFGYAHKVQRRLVVTAVVGVLLNAPLSFILIMAVAAVFMGRGSAFGLLGLFPMLLAATVANVVGAIVLYKATKPLLQIK